MQHETHTRTGAEGTGPVAASLRAGFAGESGQPVWVASEARLALERVGAQGSHVIQACADRNRVRWHCDVERTVVQNLYKERKKERRAIMYKAGRRQEYESQSIGASKPVQHT